MNTNVNSGRRTRTTAVAVLAALSFACLGELPEPQAVGDSAQKTTYHSTDAGGAIVLRDAAGNAIARGSTTPFSTETTCGSCHDTAVITRGYHFQQGRTGPDNQLLVADDYNPQKPWLLSPGMYGKT